MATAKPAPTTRIRPRREDQSFASSAHVAIASPRTKRIANEIFEGEVPESRSGGFFKRLGQSLCSVGAQFRTDQSVHICSSENSSIGGKHCRSVVSGSNTTTTQRHEETPRTPGLRPQAVS